MKKNKSLIPGFYCKIFKNTCNIFTATANCFYEKLSNALKLAERIKVNAKHFSIFSWGRVNETFAFTVKQ